MMPGLSGQPQEIPIARDDDTSMCASKAQVGLIVPRPKSCFIGRRHIDAVASQSTRHRWVDMLVQVKADALTHALRP